MIRYNIRIDGAVAPKAYTYAELEEMGLFEFTDGIYVKKTISQVWTPLGLYVFPERSGSGKREAASSHAAAPRYRIDEYGQVIREDDYQNTSTGSSYGNSGFDTTNNSYHGGNSTTGRAQTEPGGCGRLLMLFLMPIFIIGFCLIFIYFLPPVGFILLIFGWKIIKKLWAPYSS